MVNAMRALFGKQQWLHQILNWIICMPLLIKTISNKLVSNDEIMSSGNLDKKWEIVSDGRHQV